jgi:GT2 family glycosyltransferase
MTDERPRVLIVLVNYNGFEYTRECINSLLNLDYPRYDIFTVDNGSNDGSGKKLAELFKGSIIYAELPINLGVTGGNNRGIEYAVSNNYDYILFLNNDTTVEPIFLSKMINASIEYGSSLIVPKIICFYDRNKLDHFVGIDVDWSTAQPFNYVPYPEDIPDLNKRIEIGVASTCCLLVPISLPKKIGMMDESYFMYYDDSDFTIRARRAGFRMVYEPESIIYHKCNMTTKNQQPSYFEFYLQLRNVYYFYRKLCDEPLKKMLFLSKTSLYIAVHLFYSLLRGNRKKFTVCCLIISDIIAKKMGAPPDFSKL